MFNGVVDELKNYDEITFYKEHDWITIEIGKNQLIDTETSDYPKTVQIIKKLNFKEITKINNNIIFVVDSANHHSQYLANIENKNKYYKSGYPVSAIDSIKGKWYYIE